MSTVRPDSRPVSPWNAVIGVVTRPVETLTALTDIPALAPGYLVQMVLSALAVVIVLPKSTAFTQELLAQQPVTGSPVPQAGVAGGGIGAVIGALASPWIAGVVVSLFAMLAGQFLGGSKGFGPYMRMIGYARIPVAIGGVLTSLLQLRAPTLAAMSHVSLGPAILAPDASPALRSLLVSLNLFDLWYYVLLAIGFAALHKVKPAKGWPLPALLFVVSLGLTLLSTSMTASLLPGM